MQAAHHCIVQDCAAIANADSEAQDRAAVDAGKPFGRTDADAVTQGCNGFNLFLSEKDIHGAIHDAVCP